MPEKDFLATVTLAEMPEQGCIITDPECIGGRTGKIVNSRFILDGILYELETMFLLTKITKIKETNK